MAIRLSGDPTGLASLSAPLRSLVTGTARRMMRQVETQLAEHLAGIGVRVELQQTRDVRFRRREARHAVVMMRLLAHARIWLEGINSVEVWRVVTKARDESSVVDEITYVATLEPGLTLTRIPILTNAIRTQREGVETSLHWRGFEWGNLPLLAHTLTADAGLNNRLLHCFNTDASPGLRITAYPGDKVGITTGYDPQRLPSREFLSCIERIIVRINEYVAEQNRARDAFVSRWQLRELETRRQNSTGNQ